MKFPPMILLAVLIISVIAARIDAEPPILDATITLRFGQDVGQNRGSLFEALDDHGRVAVGAGFLGAYNTRPRSNRQRLHFFVKPSKPTYSAEPLPRVNAHYGIYLTDQSGSLLARTRNGTDRRFYAWDPTAKQWNVAETVRGYETEVAGKALRISDRSVFYDAHVLMNVDVKQTRICEHYYAAGMLILRLQDLEESKSSNRLIAVPWTSGQTEASYTPGANPQLILDSHREFAYAFGQLDDQALVATNTGGVYSLGPQGWKVVVKPGPHSYQVYSMLNYYDRLLLGHYPTGELLAYDGTGLTQLRGWPPVMKGVADRAREAQTLAIYGGDLHVGVWPWGETWRYDRNSSQWHLVRRMFSHPAPTKSTLHPYERETAAISDIHNLWGQRVTSMVPLDESLFVATSSKTGTALAPNFLSPTQANDYGRVHRLRLPGQLSFPLNHTDDKTATTIRCLLTNDSMSIWQDGRMVAQQSVDGSILRAAPKQIHWGRGVYGTLRGTIVSHQSNLD